MEWFVQTPEDSFNNTLEHSILVVVFSLGVRCPQYRAGVQVSFSYGVVRLRRMTFQCVLEPNYGAKTTIYQANNR
jgi:hypothetical protein